MSIHCRRFVDLALAALTGFALAASAGAQGANLPDGFVLEPIGSGWSSPVTLAFLDPARMLVAEKGGAVWLVENGVKAYAVFDLSLDVLNNGDRGLLGMVADPSFATNGFLYVLHGVDPNMDGSDGEQEAYSRLMRLELASDVNGVLAEVPGTRTILLGMDWPSGIPSPHTSHATGNLRFLSDGSLLVSHGDGAHFDFTDLGGADPNGFGPGKTSIDQDIGAFRSVYENSYAGKVLRIDPATGLGLPDNPWYTGDPSAIRSRQWVMGLRNPCRLLVQPGTPDTLWIGDVGWSTYEELDRAQGGENFGWPCWEGLAHEGSYFANDFLGLCPGVDAEHDAPFIAWHHSSPGSLGFTGNCVTGMAFYQGTSYPPIYQGRLFFMDFGQGWMKAASLDAGGALVNIVDFGASIAGPVDLLADPTSGDLLLTSIQGVNGKVYRLRYVGSNLPPIAIASADPAFGPAPLATTLRGSSSYDPEGAALDFHWDLGDGTTAEAAEVANVYPDGSTTYVATLTVTDDEGRTSSSSVVITPGNTPPVITSFSSPADGSYYTLGVPVPFSASAIDAEDDASGVPLDATWRATLIHDHHAHPDWAVVDGFTGSFVPSEDGPGSHYFIVSIEITDSRGLLVSQSATIYDEDAQPEAHLIDVSDDMPRLGKPVQATAHVDYPGSYPGKPAPTLSFDWGDGSVDVFPDAVDQVDHVVNHLYAATGTYLLQVLATQDQSVTVQSLSISVRAPEPALGVFVPLYVERFVEAAEQQAIADAVDGAFAPLGVEVQRFDFDDQDELVQWMSEYMADGVVDVLLLMDFAPASIYAGQDEGSLAEQWLENGNAILWTGKSPFSEYVFEDLTTNSGGASFLALDEVLDTAKTLTSNGSGDQILSSSAKREAPNLVAINSTKALRYDQLGGAWSVRTIYAEDADKDADTILVEHVSGGIYGQFYMANLSGLNRADVALDLLYPLLTGKFRSGTKLPAH